MPLQRERERKRETLESSYGRFTGSLGPDGLEYLARLFVPTDFLRPCGLVSST